jgi:glycosyltransferase involved in cell wall biosynthesis
MSVRPSILKSAAREHLAHDLGPLRAPAAAALYGIGAGLAAAGSRAKAFRWWMRLHSGAFSPSIDRRIESRIADATQSELSGRPTGLWAAYDEAIGESARALAGSAPDAAERLLGSRILVVKRARPGERGVLVVDYSYVFPLMAGAFDLSAIAQRYFLVLEPSWADVCAPEILLFSRLGVPVFVESVESRDDGVFRAVAGGLERVPVAANWWVDYRNIPPSDGRRDIDVIMVAAWAGIKRHWRFFHALGQLRRRGHRLSAALVGYQYDKTRADIEAMADYFGVADQIQLYERIPQRQVTELLARSKVHVLWSRRECANRAIVEAMLADVPVIVRRGLTFGEPYPYINEQTGRFVGETDLADAMLRVVDERQRFAPRQWVMDHMTPQHATAIVEQKLRAAAERLGEPWSEGLVVRTSGLDTQLYWDASDRSRFDEDYRYLRTTIRVPHRSR